MTAERKTSRPSEQVCERLGGLIATAVPESSPDTRQWAAIEAQLEPPRLRRWRWRWPVLATASFLLAVCGIWLVRPPLSYRMENCSSAVDGTLTSTRPGAIAFADGSRVDLAAGARLHVKPLAFARGAELALDDGEANLAVVHRALARWAVMAGPFRVDVTGTRFQVRWAREQGHLRVAVQEGEVHVSGGRLAGDTVLRAGHALEASVREPASEPSLGPPVATSPVAQPTDTPPPSTEPTEAQHATKTSPPRRRSDAARVAAREQARNELQSAPATAQPAPAPAMAKEESPAPPSAAVPALPVDEITAERPAPPSGPRRITILPDGSLANGISGPTWVAAASGTTLSWPPANPAVDQSGPLLPKDGKLCVSGTIAGLRCINARLPKMRCNWKENWGVEIGFDVMPGRVAWGEQAPSAVAVEFQGRSNSYRLNAHRHGDPNEKLYCIANYKSGQTATPAMFKTECWDDRGDTLPDFKGVDQLNLLLPSGMEYAAFRYCITGIQVFP